MNIYFTGVGKTIQALCLAFIYRDEWPLLIICPSCLRFTIKQEILNWFSAFIEEDLILVISKGSDKLLKKSQIVIISYDIVSNLKDVIDVKQFQTCILDEAHYLKTLDSLRSLNIIPLVQKIKNVILLTGTPALSRPKELFNILSILRPDVFKDFRAFGNRYCNPKLNQVVNCINYDGCDNELELSFILKEKIMIRRLKEDILPDLPPKRRKKVLVEISQQTRNKMKKAITSADAKQFEIYLNKQMDQGQDDYFQSKENQNVESDDIMRKTFTYVYQETGIAKLECIREYLSELLENKIKFIVFAHHKIVLDEIEKIVSREFRRTFIRIDGTVKQEDRVDKVKQFQTNPSVQVAILSLQAASHGITLTACSHVVFAELYLTPAVMLQAEDRAHRINQKNTVLCHYIIAKDTLDEDIFNLLLSKYMVISSIVDGQRKSLVIDEYEEFEYIPKQELEIEIVQNEMPIKNNLQNEQDQNPALQQISIQNLNSLMENQTPIQEDNSITFNQKIPLEIQNISSEIQNNMEDYQNNILEVQNILKEDNKINLQDLSTNLFDDETITQFNDISIEHNNAPLQDKNTPLQDKSVSNQENNTLLKQNNRVQEQNNIEENNTGLEKNNTYLEENNTGLEENKILLVENNVTEVENQNITQLDNLIINQDSQPLVVKSQQNTHIEDSNVQEQVIHENQNLLQKNIQNDQNIRQNQQQQMQDLLKLIQDDISSEEEEDEDSDEDDSNYIMYLSQRSQNILTQEKQSQIITNSLNNQNIQNNKQIYSLNNSQSNSNLITTSDSIIFNNTQNSNNLNSNRKSFTIKQPLTLQIKNMSFSQFNTTTQDQNSQQIVENTIIQKNSSKSAFKQICDDISFSQTQNFEFVNTTLKRSRQEFEDQEFTEIKENDKNIQYDLKRPQFKIL